MTQYVRSVFVMYDGTKDTTNIAITIQNRYYYVNINYTTTCPTSYPFFNPTSYLGKNMSLGDGISSESLFNMHVINPLYF